MDEYDRISGLADYEPNKDVSVCCTLSADVTECHILHTTYDQEILERYGKRDDMI